MKDKRIYVRVKIGDERLGRSFEFPIDMLREKLTAANDRLVLLEAEANCQFMYVCENDEELEILRTKNEKTISLVDALFCEFNKIKSNLPSSIFSEVNRLETVFRDLYPDREVLPW